MILTPNSGNQQARILRHNVYIIIEWMGKHVTWFGASISCRYLQAQKQRGAALVLPSPHLQLPIYFLMPSNSSHFKFVSQPHITFLTPHITFLTRSCTFGKKSNRSLILNLFCISIKTYTCLVTTYPVLTEFPNYQSLK